MPPPPRLQPSIPVEEYPSLIHAALAVIDGTARTRTNGNDYGEGEEATTRDRARTRTNGNDDGEDGEATTRDSQGNPPDPRPQQ